MQEVSHIVFIHLELKKNSPTVVRAEQKVALVPDCSSPCRILCLSFSTRLNLLASIPPCPAWLGVGGSELRDVEATWVPALECEVALFNGLEDDTDMSML
jgi:hypothetical protein